VNKYIISLPPVHSYLSPHSIYWEEYYGKSQYPRLFPPCPPRIVDPANPSNNLHNTGICGRGNMGACDYGEGGGSWDNFVKFVETGDLTKTGEEILKC